MSLHLDNPSESFKININNDLLNGYYHGQNLFFKNKLFLNNSYSDYHFNKMNL